MVFFNMRAAFCQEYYSAKPKLDAVYVVIANEALHRMVFRAKGSNPI